MTENTQSQENRNAPLTDLVDELEVMRKDDAASGKSKPAVAKKARMDRIYEDFNTKETVLEAIGTLEAMKADLEKRKEEKEGMDVDTVNVQITAIDKAMEPLKVALESLKALSETNPAVVSLSQQLGQLEVQKNELSATLRNYEGIGDPSAQIAAIDRAIADFKAVIRYFEKTSERIADVDTRYAELPGETAVPLPVNPEERRKVLALQKKTARKMRGTLRSLSLIEEPGRGQLAEGETIRERTEAFIGGETVNENEVIGMKPDKREEIMTLWYAGLEPDAENLRKVRAFFKTPDYLRVRTYVNKAMEKNSNQAKINNVMSYSAYNEMVKNVLARMFSQKKNTDVEIELEEIFYEIERRNYVPFNSRNSNIKMSQIDYHLGELMTKFEADKSLGLAVGRTIIHPNGFKIDYYQDLPEKKQQLVNEQEKIIIAEVFPFIAEQLGAGIIRFDEINYVNRRLPGFITFNEQDGPAMTENIAGTGGRDAINRLASLRYHAAKNEKKAKENNEAKAREEEQKQYREMQEKQRNAEDELMNADKRIKELIQSAFTASEKHKELKNLMDRYEGKLRERDRLYNEAGKSAAQLFALGVSQPAEDDYESQQSVPYLDLVIEKAKKRASAFMVGKETKKSIESYVYGLENERRALAALEKELEEGKAQNEENRRRLSAMSEELIRQINEIDEEVNKRDNIETVGNMRKDDLNNQRIYLNMKDSSGIGNVKIALDTLRKNIRSYMEGFIIK